MNTAPLPYKASDNHARVNLARGRDTEFRYYFFLLSLAPIVAALGSQMQSNFVLRAFFH